MPFGPYQDFQDCLDKNAGKSSPEAYCAWIEHEITGEWPGDMSLTAGMDEKLRDLYLAHFQESMAQGQGELKSLANALTAVTAAGWTKRNGQWLHQSNHSALRTIRNVQIFAEGTWNGDSYSYDDLRQMANNFKMLRGRIDPPLKLGHSSDEFNSLLALKMGIPPEMLTGEYGSGAIALGWVEDLRVEGNVLIADFGYVPDAIAQLIESRAYRKLSSEIMFGVVEDGVTYGIVLCGVALLGAELPAVSEITGLETAAVYSKYARRGDKEVEGGEVDKDEIGRFDALWAKLKGRLLSHNADRIEPITEPVDDPKPDKLQEVDNMKAVNLTLGLAENASEEEVVAAIKALQESAARVAQFSDMQAERETHLARITELETEVKGIRKQGRIAHYTAKAAEWKHLEGKPEDMAIKLVELEEASKEQVETLVSLYDRLNEQAGVAFKPLGANGEPDEMHAFERRVDEIKKAKRLSDAEAYAEARKEAPALEREYRKANRPTANVEVI